MKNMECGDVALKDLYAEKARTKDVAVVAKNIIAFNRIIIL